MLMFRNRVLKRTFEPKMEEVTRAWRNFIKETERGGSCSVRGTEKKCVNIFGQVQLKDRRFKRRWEDNIKIDKEIGRECVKWIHQAEDKDQ
jgi:hypothetical protein